VALLKPDNRAISLNPIAGLPSEKKPSKPSALSIVCIAHPLVAMVARIFGESFLTWIGKFASII
jgi:hypothetical protein